MQRKLLFLIIPAVIAVIVAVLVTTAEPTEPNLPITIDGVQVNVEIADEPAELQKGLMYRESLGENDGMLFIFEREGRHSFWMMNMKINLDMIWIDKDGKVVYIVEGAKPCIDEFHTSQCTYEPDTPAKYVLEVNAGFVKKYSIDMNSILKIGK